MKIKDFMPRGRETSPSDHLRGPGVGSAASALKGPRPAAEVDIARQFLSDGPFVVLIRSISAIVLFCAASVAFHLLVLTMHSMI